MATYYKPFPTRPILDAGSVVMPNPGQTSGDFSFVATHTLQRERTYDNIDGFGWVIALDSRFLVAPSGWNA